MTFFRWRLLTFLPGVWRHYLNLATDRLKLLLFYNVITTKEFPEDGKTDMLITSQVVTSSVPGWVWRGFLFWMWVHVRNRVRGFVGTMALLVTYSWDFVFEERGNVLHLQLVVVRSWIVQVLHDNYNDDYHVTRLGRHWKSQIIYVPGPTCISLAKRSNGGRSLLKSNSKYTRKCVSIELVKLGRRFR